MESWIDAAVDGAQGAASLPAFQVVAVCFGAYLLGSVPWGFLLAWRFARVDIRTTGSGNIGATNVARAAGSWLGAATLALDVSKGALPVLLARDLFGLPMGHVVVCGFCAVLGHVFSLFLRFRGGKGVATAFGVFLAIMPWLAVAGAATFWGVRRASGFASLGSIAGVSVSTLGALVVEPRIEVKALAVSLLVLVVGRHRSNIRRMVDGSEPRVSRRGRRAAAGPEQGKDGVQRNDGAPVPGPTRDHSASEEAVGVAPDSRDPGQR